MPEPASDGSGMAKSGRQRGASWRCGKRTCGDAPTSVCLMSWVYWGIVVGLMAMVATVLFCIGCLSSSAKGVSPAPTGKLDEPKAAVGQASDGYRQAA
jgi:hypothetical protein